MVRGIFLNSEELGTKLCRKLWDIVDIVGRIQIGDRINRKDTQRLDLSK